MPIKRLASRDQHRRQQGSAYVLVLGIVMMLVVLGIGSTLLSRVFLEQNQLGDDAVDAKFAAVSALDVMHKRIDGGNGWRSLVTNDTWTGGETYAQATVQYKFVDELDENLSNDATQPFRLYAKASVGNAVQVFSIEFSPDDTGGYRPDAKTIRRESN
ncbi:MAG: hypothetical protein AB8C95_06805 [Phycisphaeraceae bacterium]